MADRTPIPPGAYERLMRRLHADAQRRAFLEQMQAARNAEDMVGRHSVGPDTRQQAHPNLISNALLAGTLGGAMSASGLPSVGLRAGLIGGGLTDATLNAGNPEGGAEISGALAAAGALGRHSIPAALAALGASSSEASGMPFHSWMKRLNALNKVEPTAMYVNPTNAELLGMMRDAREIYPTSPTVRLLRDQRSNDVYGVEGSSILHDDMRKHLKLKYEFSPGSQGSTLPELDTELHFLKSLPRLAGGGAIKRLGKAAMSAFDDLRPSTVAPQGALSVVKNKGGNWLAGSVEDALKGLKTPLPIGERTAEEYARNEPLNQWIEGPLTKYVKTRMASPDDEVRKLAEQGVLHYDPETIGSVPPQFSKRETAGFPSIGVAETPMGKRWEAISDSHVIPTKVGDWQKNIGTGPTSPELAAIREQLSKAKPDETAYNVQLSSSGYGDDFSSNLGFNHLIDELSNALNPNSGLPPHLQLTPEAVKQMSMEKAVRRVADINAHRAAVQAAANQELANKAMVVREYTDPALPNPKGLRWVELKANQEPTEGLQRAKIRGRDVWVDENGIEVTPGRAELERQLKYEGDTMGHCVGGYCPDVLEGRSRIFSLRDAKGEPHVTVEVGDKWNNEVGAKSTTVPSIIQIKGKQNRAPNPEYLPFVQDFVRNSPLGGQWGDVGDIQNTGLRRARDVWNELERVKIKEAGHEVGDFVSSEDKERIGRAVWGDTWGKYASGGSVKKPPPPDNFQAIIAALEQELAHAAS